MSVVALIHNYHILFILVAARLATRLALIAPASQDAANNIIGAASNVTPSIVHPLDAPLHNITHRIGGGSCEPGCGIQNSTNRSVECTK